MYYIRTGGVLCYPQVVMIIYCAHEVRWHLPLPFRCVVAFRMLPCRTCHSVLAVTPPSLANPGSSIRVQFTSPLPSSSSGALGHTWALPLSLPAPCCGSNACLVALWFLVHLSLRWGQLESRAFVVSTFASPPSSSVSGTQKVLSKSAFDRQPGSEVRL